MPRHRHAIEVEKIDGGWRVHAPKVPSCTGVGRTPVTALRSFAAELALGTHRGATTDMLGIVDELVSGDALSRVLELEGQSQPSARTPRRSAAPVAERVLQLKVTLRHCRPPIWRRVLVPGGMTLDRLHRVLQAAMGWTDSHLHAFEARDTLYQIPDPDFPPLRPVVDERTVAVGSIMRKAKDELRYDYDFGDGWEHDVVLEKVLPATSDQRVPAITDGRRACPPEDVGGPWGYGDLLAVLKDPSHEEHDARSEWIGREFDSERFDVEEMDACVAELAKPRGGGRRRRS